MITRTRKQVFEHWIAALRSGKYKQTQGQLRKNLKPNNIKPVYGYCCLGVLCDLAVKDGGQPWKRTGESPSGNGVCTEYNGHDTTLSDVVTAFMGLTESDLNNLIAMNDDDAASFGYIAKHIEQHVMPAALTRPSVGHGLLKVHTPRDIIPIVPLV